jgi:hypothetical protein
VVVTKSQGKHELESASVGFAELSIFDKTPMNRAVVRNGNPRMLIGGHVDGVTAKEQNNSQLSWEVQEYAAFNNIRQIVPQNCLVGQDEAIPGLKTQTGKFPHPRD